MILQKKKGFTLLELMIVIGIMGILFVILFRAYTTISQVTFRVQLEKNIQQEMIRISQTLQNIADNYTIDFEEQGKHNGNDSLFLSGEEGKIILSHSGTCLPSSQIITGFSQDQIDDPCKLIFIKNDITTAITTPSQSLISKPYFTIFPEKPNEKIIQDKDRPFLHIKQPAFQVNFNIYTPLYQKDDWIKTSSIIFQQFFNLKK